MSKISSISINIFKNKFRNLFFLMFIVINASIASVDSIPYPLIKNKIRLGWQTSGDGLIYRGLASDTITKPTNYVDKRIKAYMILDTTTNIQWHYKKATSNAWLRVGGSISSGLTGTLPVANGGTGASVRTFVDTINTQTVNGAKTFNNITTFADSIKVQGIRIGTGTVNDETNLSIGIRNLTASTTSGGGQNGIANLGIGLEVLRDNTTGNQNTGIGVRSLQVNTTGSLNVALGALALQFNTTGNNNLAIGSAALRNNTTGISNVGIGRDALLDNANGEANTAIGLGALEKNTGNFNTAIGYRAGNANTANDNTTGANNTFIGSEAVGASATASNVITLGNSSIATIRAKVTTITSLSDIRDKTNVMPLNYGIDFIKKLNPVSFDWDMRDGGKIGISEIGFIAQELQQAQIDYGVNVPNLVYDINPDKLEASYGVLIPIIVKALKEQQSLIDELKQRILNLENK